MTSADLLWSWATLAELEWTRHGGLPFEAPGHRLERLVRHAREHSPFYRELYAGLPAQGAGLESLPRVTKGALMSRFDDWATDRRIRLRDVKRFLADPRRIGERFLGRYGVWTSSGTSGVPGIFVQDAQAMGVYEALVAAQFEDTPWQPASPLRALAGGSRAALVVATGGHFASFASWERMRREYPAFDARAFSVLDPLPKTVAGLNDYQPAILAGYASVLAILAEERAAGRLAIFPAIVWSGGEHLAPGTRRAIERAFGCPVMNEYGASECLSIAHECAEGWMHLHHEWALIEGVQADGSPTPAGATSHTTLLTNLANRVQPVIRYDLGDRITLLAAACPCGSALPAFQVQGREEEPLCLRSGRGESVRLAPLALATVVEEVAGAYRFQIAQTGARRLALRFEGAPGAAQLGRVRARAAGALGEWLRVQSLPDVEVVQDRARPRIDPASGKMRSVVVEFRKGV